MTEEKNGVKNGEATTEMAPQEDGTKVPLTNDAGPEAKFTPGADNPPNGEVKVDVGAAPTFSGLSKEELMKYSDDPYWVRLRWFLFLLFWAGWVLMLVMAIVIIIQAPRCAPKETLRRVQESAMVDYDPSAPMDIDNDSKTGPEDVSKLAEELGVTTVYLEKLISPLDFTQLNEKYNQDEVMGILEQAKKDGLYVVTDFIDVEVDPNNVWVNDANFSSFFEPNSNRLNMKDDGLLKMLKAILSDWVAKGVQGFLISDTTNRDLESAKTYLDEALKEVDGAVVSGVTDMKNEFTPGFDAARYRQFLVDHDEDWSYFKYNPQVAEGIINELVDLVTMTLFLVRGTPILYGFDPTFLVNERDSISTLSTLREKESIQVGKMIFLNSTDENIIAFARVLKGTPGYAVAVNMGDGNVTSVDFTSIEGVDGKGEIHLITNQNGTQTASASSEKQELNHVVLGPLEGIVLQFVPSF